MKIIFLKNPAQGSNFRTVGTGTSSTGVDWSSCNPPTGKTEVSGALFWKPPAFVQRSSGGFFDWLGGSSLFSLLFSPRSISYRRTFTDTTPATFANFSKPCAELKDPDATEGAQE